MITAAINKAVQRRNLTEAEMIEAVEIIAEGKATDAQIGAFLAALRMKGETVEEIAGAAMVMREKSSFVPVRTVEDEYILDIVGTGGDAPNTFNVSTTSAFVAAGAGIKVAKHGNRSISSQCGSADVIEALGVNLELTPEQVGVCVERVGIGYLFAPKLHAAMKYVMGPRRELAMRTVFNVLGPLTNPARATALVMGVFSADLTETMATVLGRLGCRGALVVHGEDGCDEISITGPTKVSRLKDGRVETFTVTPEDFGLEASGLEQIKGGDSSRNAELTLGVLKGEKGPCRDMVLANTSAALVVVGDAETFKQGAEMAAEIIDSGAALQKLNDLVAFSLKTTRDNADRKAG